MHTIYQDDYFLLTETVTKNRLTKSINRSSYCKIDRLLKYTYFSNADNLLEPPRLIHAQP